MFENKFWKWYVRSLHLKLKDIAKANLKTPKSMERYTMYMNLKTQYCLDFTYPPN